MCTVFTACDFFASDGDGDSDTPTPTEVSVSGYEKEIVVGEEIYTKLKVQQKLNDEWEEIPKADYVVTCDYDKTKYGIYELKVTLSNFKTVSFSDKITVKPKLVEVPTFSVQYSGEVVSPNVEFEKFASQNTSGVKMYEVVTYEKKTDVGKYMCKLKLVNSDIYAWADSTGNAVADITQLATWEITPAPKRNKYLGQTNLELTYGDTLYEVISENRLNFENGMQIDLDFIDDDGNVLDNSTIITDQTSLRARFRPNANYEYNNALVFVITNIKTTASYTIEHYKKTVSGYVLADTETLSGNIGDVVTALSKNYDGFTYVDGISIGRGKIIKDGSLVLKLYYEN